MTVLRKALLGFLVACLAGACGSESRRDQDDPDAPVHLWPAPVFGAEDAGVRFVIAGHSGSHVGTLPIGDPSRALLDPDQVYMFGSFGPLGCAGSAIAPVVDRAAALVGFDCDATPGFVRPTDGRFVYQKASDDPELYAFHCDGCIYVDSSIQHPFETIDNDERIAAGSCVESGTTRSAVFVGADGRIVYRCSDDHWYDDGGVELTALAGRSLHDVAFGYEDTALTEDGIIVLSTGELFALDGLPSGSSHLAYRAREDGYWLALERSARATPQLWHVAFDGTATMLGRYVGGLPELSIGRGASVLDGSGRLIQHGNTRDLLAAVAIRTIEGQAEVAYEGSEDALFRGGLRLFTGP